MSLSLAQKRALDLLRPHRSERSWIGGSIVLHEILNRPIGDIDIHHHNDDEMNSSIDRDTELLQQNGFFWVNSEHDQFEIERVFLVGKDVVAINWVRGLPKTLFPLCRNNYLGTCIDVRDAVFQKLLMVFDAASLKHFHDLADCANSQLLDRSLLNAAAQIQRGKPPAEFADFIERSLLQTGHLISGAIHGRVYEQSDVRIRKPA